MNAVEYSTVGDAITDLGRRRSYAPGDLLFVEGDGSHSVYACVEGRVRIFLTTPSGRELLIGIKAPGDEFGDLRRANDRLVTRNSNSATVRTGRMLVELASMMMRHGGPAGTYELPLTQAELAGWIGATRESTARALARFRQAGLVRTGRGQIVVLDVLGLNELVSAG